MKKGRPGIILALDVRRPSEAERILETLGTHLRHVKIGPRLFSAGGMPFVRRVIRAGFEVFLDLKLHDIPNTIAEAVDLLARSGIWALTLHASGGEEMLKAAVLAKRGARSEVLLLGVTVLTSLDQPSLDRSSPGSKLRETIKSRALLCKECGFDGVVCSPRDLLLLDGLLPGGFLRVVPGIRDGEVSRDDQKRTAGMEEAMDMGADFVVIGRPVIRSSSPTETMARFAERLDLWRKTNV